MSTIRTIVIVHDPKVDIRLLTRAFYIFVIPAQQVIYPELFRSNPEKCLVLHYDSNTSCWRHIEELMAAMDRGELAHVGDVQGSIDLSLVLDSLDDHRLIRFRRNGTLVATGYQFATWVRLKRSVPFYRYLVKRFMYLCWLKLLGESATLSI